MPKKTAAEIADELWEIHQSTKNNRDKTVAQSADDLRKAFQSGKGANPEDVLNVLGDPTRGVSLNPNGNVETDEERTRIEDQIQIEGDESYAEVIIEMGPELNDQNKEANK